MPQSPTELSIIARQGSGSACRSLLGGYVAWDAGTANDGSDSKARVVAPREHWPEMRALILVASAEKKSVSSTAGMQTTVATSALFATRAEKVVPMAMQDMESAIKEKDFERFAEVTMKESNSFHACCLDTSPPIFYLNDVSRAAIRCVENINEKAGKNVAAYTFDAGPNCVVYYLVENENAILGHFKSTLGHLEGWTGKGEVSTGAQANEDDPALQALRRGITRVILTSVGEGPISVQEHLINEKGEPSEY